MKNKILCTYYKVQRQVNKLEYIEKSEQEEFKDRLDEDDFDYDVCQKCGSPNIILSAIFRDTPHPDQIQILMAIITCIDCHAVEDAELENALENGTMCIDDSSDSLVERILSSKAEILLGRQVDPCEHACCNEECAVEGCLDC